MADEELRNNESEQTPANRRLRLGGTEDNEDGQENEGDEEIESTSSEGSRKTVNLMERE